MTSKEKASSIGNDKQLVALTTLLLLEQEARHKENVEDLTFLITNETYRLFSYRQCLFWETNALGKVKIKTVSGLSIIDADSPYIVWLEGIIEEEISSDDFKGSDKSVILKTYDTSSFDKETQKDLKEWGVKHSVLLSMNTTQEAYKCGIWLDREKAFQEREQRLLSQISDAYSHALDRLLRKNDSWRRQVILYFSLSNVHKFFIAMLFIVLLFPVRMSVVAPAEVVASNPFIVGSPVQGVIADIDVSPNDAVNVGDPLIQMEDTVLRNEAEFASKELDIAQTAYMKASREAFSDAKSKSQLAMLQADIESKKLKYDYALELLSLLTITAKRDGIVVFTDSNSLRGLPVKPGERIMSLVNPKETELLIRVPADGVILFNKDVSVKLFLNVSPLDGLKAGISTISYEATPDPDGLLTYKIKAKFLEGEPNPSIGLKGTARVYGGYTIFGYQMLRRPLANIRRIIGI